MLELPYVAGIIDADGCIHFELSGEENITRTLRLHISVMMTNIEIPSLLYKQFGGYLNSHEPKGNRKTVYRWRITGEDAVTVLEQIFPFLRIKIKQAALGMMLYSKSPALRSDTDTVLIFKNKMHDLNRVGKVANT